MLSKAKGGNNPHDVFYEEDSDHYDPAPPGDIIP